MVGEHALKHFTPSVNLLGMTVAMALVGVLSSRDVTIELALGILRVE